MDGVKHGSAVVAALALVTWAAASWAAAALAAGPEVGKAVPALKVLDVTGQNSPNEVDYAELRKELPTIYVFVPADKWDRPTARFLRKLDEAVAKQDQASYVVAVWLTDDVEKTKKYLPLAQQSLQFARTALACYTADKSGPSDWQLDLAASLTVVVATQAKVADVRDYRSVNETLVPEVVESLKEALKKAAGKAEGGK